MKIVYLGIILASLLIATSYAKPVHADSIDPVQILDVHVEPSMLKVNDTFSISTTIFNSFPYPIYLTSGSCTPAFSISFDTHVKQVHPGINCTSEAILEKVDPDGETTISNTNKPGTIYQAVLAGTSNANITIPYFAKNQTATDDSNINYITSKSFQFLIHDSNEISQKPPAYFLPPLQQIRAGALIQNVKCSVSFNLIIKSEDGSPACVKPDTANVLIERGWAITGFTYGGGPITNSTMKTTHADMTVVEDTGTTVIGNQTYYFTTLNDTLTSYHGIAAIPFTFHDVDFTLFPSVFSAGPIGSCGDTNFGTEVKFADMTYERLDVHIPGSPCVENYTETAFTNHENSQVGLEDYHGKIRLLVGSDSQPSSALQLSLLVNSQYQTPSEPVGIDVYLNNTTSKPITLTDSSNWPRNDLTSGMCSNLPFGISILKGYYDEQNMTGAKSLLLYGTAPCPVLPQIKSYTFQPSSTKATQECDTLFSCTGLVDMKKHFDIGDYIDNNKPHQSFKTGTYTIVAGDKWGHVSIQHFTEADTVAYDNSSLSKGN